MFAPDHEASPASSPASRSLAAGSRLANWTPGRASRDVPHHGPVPASSAAEQPVRVGRRGRMSASCSGDAFELQLEEHISTVAAGVGRGVLGALLDELRTDEDARRVARGPERGAAPGVGRLLRARTTGERRDRPAPRVPARARNAPLTLVRGGRARAGRPGRSNAPRGWVDEVLARAEQPRSRRARRGLRASGLVPHAEATRRSGR